MKKTLIAIIAGVLVLGAIAFIVLLQVENLPEYALKQIVEEVNEKGIDAIEPHLTSSMKQAYGFVTEIVKNPLVKLIGKSNMGAKVYSALNETKAWDWAVQNIKRSKNTADITISLSAAEFKGNLDIDMVRIQGEWFIQDISIPVTSWVF